MNVKLFPWRKGQHPDYGARRNSYSLKVVRLWIPLGTLLQINHLQLGTRGCWVESMLDRVKDRLLAIFRFGTGRVLL
jgi:hypothetical protein